MTTVAPGPIAKRSGMRTLQGFAELAADAANRSDPAWLGRTRTAAAARFAETGLPGSRDEEWRFTSLQSLAAHRFELRRTPSPVAAGDIAPHVAGFGGGPLLVVVDGIADANLSRIGTLPSGVRFGSIAAEIAAGNPLIEKQLAHTVSLDATPFAAANAALFVDGAFLHVPAGVSTDALFHVLHVATDAAANSVVSPRSLFVVERGGVARVVESFVALKSVQHDGTTAAYFRNAVCEVVMAEGARLEHLRLQRESHAAWHVGFTGVEQQRDSHYRSFTLDLGGRLSRQNLHARLGGVNVETLLYGLYLARGEQLVDNHTAIFHDQPDCRSWEVYKGVLAERAHGVFNGKVIVQPVAQKTDAKQTNRNLLLSDTARIDTKPQLEIFADDVKCTHGATVGKLNEQQRFYLRTRGIAGREAEQMLIAAFVSEVLAEITEPTAREHLQALVHAEMSALIG